MIMVVLLTMFILAGVLVVTANLALSSRRTTTEQKSNIPAQMAAESGVALAKAKIKAANDLLSNIGMPIDSSGTAMFTGAQMTAMISKLCPSPPTLPMTGTYGNTALTLSNGTTLNVPNSQLVCTLSSLSPTQAQLFSKLIPVDGGQYWQGIQTPPKDIATTSAVQYTNNFLATDDTSRNQFFSDVFSGPITTTLNNTAGSKVKLNAGLVPIALVQLNKNYDGAYRLYFQSAQVDSTGTQANSTKRITIAASQKVNAIDLYFSTKPPAPFSSMGLYVDSFDTPTSPTTASQVISTNIISGRVHSNTRPNFGHFPSSYNVYFTPNRPSPNNGYNIKLNMNSGQFGMAGMYNGWLTSAGCYYVDYTLANPCISPEPTIYFRNSGNLAVTLNKADSNSPSAVQGGNQYDKLAFSSFNVAVPPNAHANSTTIPGNTKLPFIPGTYDFGTNNPFASLDKTKWSAYGVTPVDSTGMASPILALFSFYNDGSNTLQQPDFMVPFIAPSNDDGSKNMSLANTAGINIPTDANSYVDRLQIYPSSSGKYQLLDIVSNKTRYLFGFDKDNKMYKYTGSLTGVTAPILSPDSSMVAAKHDAAAAIGWRPITAGETGDTFNGMLYVNGTLKSFTGPARAAETTSASGAKVQTYPVFAKPALASFAKITLTVKNNLVITGDLLNTDRCSVSTDKICDKNISGAVRNNMLGIFVVEGNVYLPYNSGQTGVDSTNVSTNIDSYPDNGTPSYSNYQNTAPLDPASSSNTYAPAAPTNLYLDAFIYVAKGGYRGANTVWGGNTYPATSKNYNGSIYYIDYRDINNTVQTNVLSLTNTSSTKLKAGNHGVLNIYGSLGVRAFPYTYTAGGSTGGQGWNRLSVFWDKRGSDSATAPTGFPTMGSSGNGSTAPTPITAWSNSLLKVDPISMTDPANASGSVLCSSQPTPPNPCPGYEVPNSVEVSLDNEILQRKSN